MESTSRRTDPYIYYIISGQYKHLECEQYHVVAYNALSAFKMLQLR